MLRSKVQFTDFVADNQVFTTQQMLAALDESLCRQAGSMACVPTFYGRSPSSADENRRQWYNLPDVKGAGFAMEATDLEQRDGLFFTLLLRDIKQRFGFSYPELVAVAKRERLIPCVAENFGMLHYYGGADVIDLLESDLGVSFAKPQQ